MGAREVMRRVRDGYRLERPSHCHPDLYKIISKCWAGDMNKRPDFSELRLVSFPFFSKMGEKGEEGVKNLKKWVTSFMAGPKFILSYFFE